MKNRGRGAKISMVSNKRTLTTAEIDDQVTKLQDQWNEVIASISPLQEKASRLYTEITALRNKKDKIIFASKNKVDWAWLLEMYPESTAKNEFRKKQFQKLGLMPSAGYWVDTTQAVVKIRLNKHELSTSPYKNAKQLKGVKKLLPFIKVGEKGFKRIGIFEHTLSINGGYCMGVFDDGQVQIIHTYSNPIKFKTLEDAFEYVSENLWYE